MLSPTLVLDAALSFCLCFSRSQDTPSQWLHVELLVSICQLRFYGMFTMLALVGTLLAAFCPTQHVDSVVDTSVTGTTLIGCSAY